MKKSSGHNPSMHLKNAIEYILNEDKTCYGKYVGSSNCFPENAYAVMKDTKKEFNKTDGRQGYHIVISFHPDENVNEETAYQIMSVFAIAFLGENYEYVFAVHNNEEHMHAHLIYNSVNRLDGYKYHYKKGDWEKYIQPITNDICQKYNLGTIDIKEQGEWTKQNEKNSAYAKIKTDIQECMNDAKSYYQFKNFLAMKGYKMKDNKYLSLCPPGKKEFTRTQTVDKKLFKKDIMKYFDLKKSSDSIEWTNDKVTSDLRTVNHDWKKIKYDAKDFYISDPRLKKDYLLSENDRKKKRTKGDHQAWKYKADVRKVEQRKEKMEYLDKMNIKSSAALTEREKKLERMNKDLTNERIKIYQERYPYKNIIEIVKNIIEVEADARHYSDGNNTYKEEYSQMERLIYKLSDEGVTLDEAKKLFYSFDNRLNEITNQKKLISKEKKIIDRIKEPQEKRKENKIE